MALTPPAEEQKGYHLLVIPSELKLHSSGFHTCSSRQVSLRMCSFPAVLCCGIPSLHFPFPDAAYNHIECLLTVYTVSDLTFALTAASFCISGDSTGTLIEDCQLLPMLLPDSDKLEGPLFPRKGSEISVSLTLPFSYKDCQWWPLKTKLPPCNFFFLPL